MSDQPSDPTSAPTTSGARQQSGGRTFMDMNGYQWTVLFAAWLGWGFDVFDGLLFNYVAPNCVPTLLHLPIGSPEAAKASLFWNGVLSSILLLGWAAGGILFGQLADRIGRTRTLMMTMLLYALGTSLCAAAPNLGSLILFRLVASLGIGGEWAAGAAMVAEVVPEKRRVEAGALLYTSAPAGLFLATFANYQIAGVFFKGSPETSWRYVFLCGLIPAVVAFAVRIFVREPERWKQAARDSEPPRLRELFRPGTRKLTRSGVSMAVIALITWWSCNVFIPLVSTGLARARAHAVGLDRLGTLALVESWKSTATNMFNWGGLIGTLLTIPAAKIMGRRPMFGIYYFFSGIAARDPAAHVLPDRAHRLRNLWQLHLLPARAVPDAPSRYRRRLLLQHRPRRRGGRSFPGRHGRLAGNEFAGDRHARAVLRRLRSAARPAAVAPGHRNQGQRDCLAARRRPPNPAR
jgi:MFS family permease